MLRHLKFMHTGAARKGALGPIRPMFGEFASFPLARREFETLSCNLAAEQDPTARWLEGTQLSLAPGSRV